MRLPSLFLTGAALAAVACVEPTPLATAFTGLNGSWRTAPIPSGAGIGMTLSTGGPYVTGTGAEGGIAGVHIANLSVSGQVQRDSTFILTLAFDDGTNVTYFGQLIGPDELRGTWRSSTQPDYVTVFYRQPSTVQPGTS